MSEHVVVVVVGRGRYRGVDWQIVKREDGTGARTYTALVIPLVSLGNRWTELDAIEPCICDQRGNYVAVQVCSRRKAREVARRLVLALWHVYDKNNVQFNRNEV
jgi:hypothetical protein